MEISRERIESYLDSPTIEWGVGEDASLLIDILLESYTLEGVYTWLFFHNSVLHGTPLFMLEQGHHREVFAEARRLTSMEAS